MPESIRRIKLGSAQLPGLFEGPGVTARRISETMFHDYSWNADAPGTVEFIHGTHSFTMNNVSTMGGDTDMETPGEGVTDWNITFEVTRDGDLEHEAARARIMEFLAMLRAKGWRRFIEPNAPRLAGRQAWQYNNSDALDAEIYSLDSMYTPTMEEWKAVLETMPKWDFYADGVYLEVMIDALVGVNVEIQSENDFYSSFFWGDREKVKDWRTNLKSYLPGELEESYADRLKKEAELKAQGYYIDTDYQDPPVKALQAKQGNGY